MRVVIQNQINKTLFSLSDTEKRWFSDNSYLHKLWGTERQETQSYPFMTKRNGSFKLGKGRKSIIEPSIYFGDRYQMEKSGLWWTIKKPDETTIKIVEEKQMQIEQLRKEINDLLKDKWDEFSPLSFDDVRNREPERVECLERIFNQVKGIDQSIKKEVEKVELPLSEVPVFKPDKAQ